jgi:hypothetical protein
MTELERQNSMLKIEKNSGVAKEIKHHKEEEYELL